jgi:uncharacterized protein YoxC
MNEAALSVAIAAIAITLFGVILQWLAYRATIDQAQKAAQSVADMRTEIHGLVGELRGMTERMVEAQERQFNRMLDAFVTRPGAAAEVAERTGESAERLQQISDAMEALKEEIRHAVSADEVQHKLDELASRVEAVSESTARAARLAEAAARPAGAGGLADRERVAEITEDFLTSGRGSQPLLVEPAEVEPGGRVTISQPGVLPPAIARFLTGRGLRDCEVRTPGGRPFTQDWPDSQPEIIFPDEFQHASMDVEGEYTVTVYRPRLASAARVTRKPVSRGRFHVRSGGSDD